MLRKKRFSNVIPSFLFISAMKGYKEITLDTDRLTMVRIKGETHGTEVNEVLCDTIESLEPWIDWAFKKPTVEVKKVLFVKLPLFGQTTRLFVRLPLLSQTT